MDARRWMILAVVALVVCVVTAAGADQRERPRPGAALPELTPEERAVVDQAQDLRKEIEINRLELRLLELKDASEEQIAERAEQLYRLQGRLYALRSKHPEVMGKLWRHRGRHARMHGRGRGPAFGGPGFGRGPGRGGHRGGPDMGFRGRGQGRGWRGMGRQHGMGRHMGPGMDRGIGPANDPSIGLEMGPRMGLRARGHGPGMRGGGPMWRGEDFWEHPEPGSAMPEVEPEEKLTD